MKNNRRIYPTSDPRFGEKFEVVSIQLVDIDGKYSELIPFELLERVKGKNGEDAIIVPAVFEIGKNFSEWRINKNTISDKICTSINKIQREGWEKMSIRERSSKPPINYRDVVAIGVRYLSCKNSTIL